MVVAEDAEITLRLMSAWLTKSGYQVTGAADGDAARQAILESRPSILVTDWNMPGMSGIELCRWVRQQDSGPYIYVIIVTSREDRRDIVQAIDAGADDYLVKPLKPHDLVSRVHKARNTLDRFNRYLALAERDSLTDTMNRRSFQTHFVREIARAVREQSTLSCMMMDLDLFKQINDTYGHSVGDSALRSVANVLRRQSREMDCICRYGGDEFCVLLPGMNENEAMQFAERIGRAMATEEIYADQRKVTLRCTMGVAEWREDIVAPGPLIDMADEALLAAKNAGRNCVVSYSSLTNQPELPDGRNDLCQARLAGVTAADVMISPIVTLGHGQSLAAAAEMFIRLRVNSMPVIDDRARLVGVVTEKDVLSALTADNQWDCPVRDIMKTNVVTYEQSTPVATIWEFLRRVNIPRVVIVRDQMPVGAISRAGLLRWMCHWRILSSESSALPPANEELARRTGAIAESLVEQGYRLQAVVAQSPEHVLPAAVCAATQLEEQAQELLALCQRATGSQGQSPATDTAASGGVGNLSAVISAMDLASG